MSRACSLASFLARSVAQNRAFSSSVPTIVYNSQSEQYMTVPGSSGIRLHLIRGEADDQRTAMQKRLATGTRLESFDCSYSELREDHVIGLMPVVSIGSRRELEALAKARDHDRVVSIIPQLSLSLFGNQESKHSVMKLIKIGVEMGFKPRGIIGSAWRRSQEKSEIDDDDDENLHHSQLSQTCINMADAGCGIVCFSDDLRHATGSSLRSAVEDAFGFDVSGESMMERLAVRLFSQGLRSKARELGVSRFDLSIEALSKVS